MACGLWDVAKNYTHSPAKNIPIPPTQTPSDPDIQQTQDVRFECENSFSVKAEAKGIGLGLGMASPHALGWALVMAGWLWLDWLPRRSCISAILCLAPKSCLQSEVVDKWRPPPTAPAENLWKSAPKIQFLPNPNTIHSSSSSRAREGA